MNTMTKPITLPKGGKWIWAEINGHRFLVWEVDKPPLRQQQHGVTIYGPFELIPVTVRIRRGPWSADQREHFVGWYVRVFDTDQEWNWGIWRSLSQAKRIADRVAAHVGHGIEVMAGLANNCY